MIHSSCIEVSHKTYGLLADCLVRTMSTAPVTQPRWKVVCASNWTAEGNWLVENLSRSCTQVWSHSQFITLTAVPVLNVVARVRGRWRYRETARLLDSGVWAGIRHRNKGNHPKGWMKVKREQNARISFRCFYSAAARDLPVKYGCWLATSQDSEGV
jgi:hypothetical protein